MASTEAKLKELEINKSAIILHQKCIFFLYQNPKGARKRVFVYMCLIFSLLLQQHQSAGTAGPVCRRRPEPSSQPDGLNFVTDIFFFVIQRAFTTPEEESWKGLYVPIDLCCLEGVLTDKYGRMNHHRRPD